jgi:hypothetical protein
MRHSVPSLLLAGLVTTLCATPAAAQATRTWVSGVGDDANPCSRTAPCKTFAGAISKTAAGGEISVLDPGGFGGVTITKSISIVADSAEGGVLVGGTNAIVVNAGANDVVHLRGLIFEGIGTGLNGIRFLAGGALHVENCVIADFRSGSAGSGHGIAFRPSGAAELYVADTVIANNGTGSNGGGILIQPTGTGSAKVSLQRVRMENNVFGLKADGNGSTGGIAVTVVDSLASGSSFSGFTATTGPGGAPVGLTIDLSVSANNGTTGVAAGGALAVIRLSNSTVTGNGTGLLAVSGGTLASYVNNQVHDNSTDGAPNAFLNPS